MTSPVAESLSVIKDIALTIAAVAGVTVSVVGLRAWRNQTKGKTEYDLARRFLRTVYGLRDAIAHVRNYVITASETAAALGIEEFPPKGEWELREKKGERAVYEKRWERVQAAISELSVEALEAEVLWGHEMRDALRPLYDHIGRLRHALDDHISICVGGYKNVTDERRMEIRETIYDSRELSNDPFATGIERVIQDIEERVKPHLRI